MDSFVYKIEEAVRYCGKIMLEADRSAFKIDEKEGTGNFVTSYDKKIQEILRDELKKILPEAVFVGEEEDVHASIEKGLAFIVDPIDGTYNFMRDLHLSVISVGLTKDGKPYAGVIYNPYADEMFSAQEGMGAWMNGEQIHVSDKPLEGGLILFGTAPYYKELRKKTFRYVDQYMDIAADVRRCGSAALDLATIAAGRAEMYFEMLLQPWDYAAGILIVKEAGGSVTDLEGNPVNVGVPSSIIARNTEKGWAMKDDLI